MEFLKSHAQSAGFSYSDDFDAINLSATYGSFPSLPEMFSNLDVT